MTKPIWLLDIDGVINSFDGTSDDRDGYVGQRIHHFHIRWRPSALARIRAFHDEGLCEIRWLTTWGRLANEHISEPLGLPIDLVVAAEQPFRDRGDFWWKLSALLALRAEHPEVPIVWTDDDITFYPEAVEYLEQSHPDLLAVCPVGEVGLSDQALDEIEAFLRECARDQ